MPDVKEVIKSLETAVKNFERYSGDEYGREYDYARVGVDGLENALALLKAQEPVEPVVDKDTWKCGNCGHTLEHQQLLGDNVLFHEQYNYCPECGRAVKWE